MRVRGLTWFWFGLAVALLQPAPALAKTASSTLSDRQVDCPVSLATVANCVSGQDANGAWYLAAVPKQWNGILVVHAHGGPRLGSPKADDGVEDLERFAVMVRQGYAWIGSTYRRGGYGVRMAAADVENSRAIFLQRFGKPRLTILHGQSYGGNVAAKLAELGAVDADGNRQFDGVLLTNGVLWGGTRAYGFRADLRAVYQYFCRNHPAPDDAQYPVWQGLPRDDRMTKREMESRVYACTGLGLPDKQRTPEQVRRLTAITGATGIAQDQLVRHLEWATFTFRDLVHLRLGSRNPFDNSGTVYRNSGDDAALNRGIERFAADPRALAELAYDSDLTGLIVVPTIAVHWAKDPIASADADKFYEAKVASQGRADYFLRLVSGKGSHSRLSDADVMAALQAVVSWVNTSEKPSQAAVQTACRSAAQELSAECTIE